MTTKIITTLSQKYWKRTGQYTVAYWKSLIPKEIQLWIHDTPTSLPINYDRSIESTNKNSWIQDARLIASSKKQPPGYYKEWDKLCHKSFAQWECFEDEPKGIMIWMDADMKFRKLLNPEVFKDLLGDRFCAYLGRDRVDTQSEIYRNDYGQYNFLSPETGVIIYNCDHEIAKDFFNSMKDTYLSMKVFNLYDWSDTGVFWNTINQFDAKHFIDMAADFTPNPTPLVLTKLDEYLEHWMGTKNKKARADIRGSIIKEKLLNQGKL